MASLKFSSFLPTSIRTKNDVVVESSLGTEEESIQKTPSVTDAVSEDQTTCNIESSTSLDALRQVLVADPDEPIVPFPPLSSLDAASTDSSNSPPDSLQEFVNANTANPGFSKATQKIRHPFSSFFSSFSSSKTESRDSLVPDKGTETDTTESATAQQQVLETDGTCIAPEMNTRASTPSVPKISSLKVLFLSSDTGGGHRASAESLAKQFQIQYPGSTYDLLDVMSEDGIYPYNSLVQSYKHLSAHPKQWQIVYGVSNTRAYEMLADVHLKVMCEHAIRKRIKSYDPDVVVSVHPLMTNVPVVSCRKISKEPGGKFLPMFTVVTDLGSAHCLWFANGVDRMFIASERIRKIAKERGKVPDEKLIQAGLPIRHDFALQAEALGNRLSAEGKAYQRKVRESLQLRTDVHTVLVMGGGEGVGCLADIVDGLYVELFNKGMEAQVIVVCGRNEALRESLASRQWNDVVQRYNRGEKGGSDCFFQLKSSAATGCLEVTMPAHLKRMLSAPTLMMSYSNVNVDKSTPSLHAGPTVKSCSSSDSEAGDQEGTVADEKSQPPETPGNVHVIGLGFVTNMAEYMVAADLLVSKAGPGTIAEAASVGLPVLLTSYLPGQEEGNVDFVIENNFGSFISDSDPSGIGEQVALWLSDEIQMQSMSEAAMRVGAPHAAADIVKVIGERTMELRFCNP